MRVVKALTLLFIFCLFQSVFAQHQVYFDLLDVKNLNTWTAHNRDYNFAQGQVQLNARSGDGLLYCKGFDLKNGRIEVDVKGRNETGRSFVGIAFNGVNDSTYDVIYFRPFNFQSPERNNHSVQYISHPKYTWSRLRADFPEQYEKTVNPVPDPEEWFHATIELQDKTVSVFVNNNPQPSLVVKQLALNQGGWLGFWVGNGSQGQFKNLRVFSN